MNPQENRPPTLMVVHAHPDDEASQTGGTLARYAASGARTVVVVCTDGSRGDGPDDAPGVPRADRAAQIAARRSHELGRARAALGISDLVELGYPDSGTSPSAADSDVFSRRPGEPIIRRLEVLMGQYEPDVVVTYPPNGLTFHPDHIRTNEVTTAAFERYAHAIGAADQTPGASGTRKEPKFYHIALSISRLKTLRSRIERVLGPNVWTPPIEIGIPDDSITTSVDVSGFWDAKLKAVAAHESQADANDLLRALRVPGGETPVEEYIRVLPAWPGGKREDDLFASRVQL
ncbi:PIG-L deacetylase family protein [Actinacidiphila rubida]|uniref:N-acetylglucosaminyl deacetylase, LmbE family n=1 Tax=Actinacidiphila rubida TaxID=310780 RepID=A0A1H8UND7_9ACTN|nr:PIG-L family deacetylase [Actinacidiphila rubida]SEP04671.1 N-acetylglucosaminyl deacetylase, LmbE family [Actinacidiphila rubida]